MWLSFGQGGPWDFWAVSLKDEYVLCPYIHVAACGKDMMAGDWEANSEHEEGQAESWEVPGSLMT